MTSNFLTTHLIETIKSRHCIRRIPFHSITILHIRKDHLLAIVRFIFISIKSGGYIRCVFGKYTVITYYAPIRITSPAQRGILDFTVPAMIS